MRNALGIVHFDRRKSQWPYYHVLFTWPRNDPDFTSTTNRDLVDWPLIETQARSVVDTDLSGSMVYNDKDSTKNN
jgi:hypothetical protein